MICVKLEGRLGNQPFQYASIYSTAKKLNTRFYLDKSVDYLLLARYLNTERDFWSFLDNHNFSIKGFKLIFSHYLRWGYYYSLAKLLLLEDITYFNNQPPIIQLNKIKKGTRYTEYFQFEQYFAPYTSEIKKRFTIKSAYQQRYNMVFSTLPHAFRSGFRYV